MGVCGSSQIVGSKAQLIKKIQNNKNQVWYGPTLKILKQQTKIQSKQNNIVPQNNQLYPNLNNISSFGRLQKYYLKLQFEQYIFSQQLKQLSTSLIQKKKIKQKKRKIRDMGRSSLSQRSMIISDQILQEQLSNFTDFCSRIIQQSDTIGSELNKLVIEFKKNIIRMINDKMKKNADKSNLRQLLIKSLNSFIKFLREYVRFKFNKLRIQSDKISTDQYIEQFLKSLIFSSSDFYQKIIQLYNYTSTQQSQLQEQLINYKIKNAIFSLDQNTLKLYNRKNYSTNSAYKSSLQKLKQIYYTKEPINKAKVLFQVIVNIQNQINQFYQNQKYNIQRFEIITIETLQDILKYLISQTEGIKIHVQIIKDFVRPQLKHNPKGCFISLYFNIFKLQNMAWKQQV